MNKAWEGDWMVEVKDGNEGWVEMVRLGLVESAIEGGLLEEGER
jgi:hypothetical protein